MLRRMAGLGFALALMALMFGGRTAHAQDLNCDDFGGDQSAAQAVLDGDPSDPNDLDADGDGIACESLSGGDGTSSGGSGDDDGGSVSGDDDSGDGGASGGDDSGTSGGSESGSASLPKTGVGPVPDVVGTLPVVLLTSALVLSGLAISQRKRVA